MTLKSIIFGILVIFLAGCTATTPPELSDAQATGAALGAVTGAVIGYNTKGHHKGTRAAAGAVAGALAGGLAGTAIDSQNPKPVDNGGWHQ